MRGWNDYQVNEHAYGQREQRHIENILPAISYWSASNPVLKLDERHQAAGHGYSAQKDFEAERSHLHRTDVDPVPVVFGDSYERCRERAKRVRERGPLRHRS